ncbi:M42 family metallopeptidase [Polycladomyces sp. WAk]|uniref:M42 family metallopeptidase n=2 Tax=Polycladomyces zharkentensis TaxID=2807616 RepID=A0ABS2WJ12_9BACL|nr:M42 family metallopeptidase [Polycladomyces sp. WAk]
MPICKKGEPEMQASLKVMLKELTEAFGPSGYEQPVRDVMRKWVEPHADHITTDNLGSLIAEKRGTQDRPRVMLAGHLDEVGWMVTRITDEGYLKFQPLGGWWSQVLPAQRVEVRTQQGTLLGVIGSQPPHSLPPAKRKEAVELKDLFIDIGVADRNEAEAMGVRPGDPIVPHSPFTVMANPKYWLAKAMDNRMGCAVAVEVMRRLDQKELPGTLYAVGTVMEEVGIRGAGTSAAVVDPDVAIVIDVGLGGDIPGTSPDQAPCHLGKGPLVVIYDALHIAHRGLLQMLRDTAKELDIPLQYESIDRGATDAGRIHLHHQGVPTISVGIPSRYIHSHTSIIHEDDLEQLVQLLTALVKKLDLTTVERLHQY